jgi:ABC-type multidrug transport system fused ATPase/permease subunit
LLWRGTLYDKFLVLFNIILIFANKGTNVLVPILLKFAVDAITCAGGVQTCPSPQQTYLLIGAYAVCKFLADFINYIREIPYTRMAANAEIKISHTVYDHVQRQSLAFHLSRETGKIIRIVSKGAGSFSSVLRLTAFSLLPILVEIIMTLVVFFTLFNW